MLRKMRGLICVVLAVMTILAVVTGCPKRAPEFEMIFRNDIAGQVGDHIFYSYDLLEGRNLTESEKKHVLQYLRKLDKTLENDIFVTGSNTLYGRSDFKIYARQITNGVVVENVTYATDLDSSTKGIKLTSKTGPVDVPDSKDVRKASDFFDKVEEEASKHISEMTIGHPRGLMGRYLLCYDTERGILVYDYIVNDYSHIYVDATTGDIIDARYWDGTITD